jgi:hypothetical protein
VIRALAPLLGEQPELLETVRAKLNDQNGNVRRAAIDALAPLLGEQSELLETVRAKLDDQNGNVRRAAIDALAPLLVEQPELLEAVKAKLDDQNGDVRGAAVKALIPFINGQTPLRWSLLPWLGYHFEEYVPGHQDIQRQLAITLAPLLQEDQELREQVVLLLESPSWPARQGATWALIGMPGGVPAELLDRLKYMLYDCRAEESWLNRLQAAKALLNHRDPHVCERAVAVAIEALDYATQPWYNLPRSGPDVRRQAALILGNLDPLYFDTVVFKRLQRVMEEDADADVRDAAYQALLRLATAPRREEQRSD